MSFTSSWAARCLYGVALLVIGCGGKSDGADKNGTLDRVSVCRGLCESFKSANCDGYSAATCESDCLGHANTVPACEQTVLSMLDCRVDAVSSARACSAYYLPFSDASCTAEASAVGQCFLHATETQDTDCAAYCKHAYQDACPNAAALEMCLGNCPLFVSTSTCRTELNAHYRCGSQVPVAQFECQGAFVSYGDACEQETSAYAACEAPES